MKHKQQWQESCKRNEPPAARQFSGMAADSPFPLYANALWKEQWQAERKVATSFWDRSITEVTPTPELDMQGDSPTYHIRNIALTMKQNPEFIIS